MALTYTGLAGPLAADKWSKMMRWATSLAGPEYVNAMAPTLPTGTRLVRIPAGFLVAAGVMVESSADEDVTLAENGGANPRIDLVVAEIDWTAEQDPGPPPILGTAEVLAVQGTNAANPVPPALTRDPGSLWQVPIARLLVRPGVGQLLAADLTDVRAGRRVSQTFGGGITPTSKTGDGEKAVRTDTIADPGFDYRVQVFASINFDNVPVGHGRMQIKIDGSTVRDVAAVDHNQGQASAVFTTGVRTGPTSVQISISRQFMEAPLNLLASGSYVEILTIPA